MIASASSLWRVGQIPRRMSRRVAALSTVAAAADDDNVGPQMLRLYQYAICPFCNKTKAVLDYAQVPYEAVEVNPLTKAEIKWSKDYRKVPIASYQDQVWKGSDVITDQILSLESVQAKLQAKWQGSDMTLEDFRRDDAEWIAWTNNRLASLLYPNICRTLGDSYTAFAYVEKVPHFGFWQRQSIRALGSAAMYLAASRVKKRLAIKDEQAALEAVLVDMEERLGPSQAFLSGGSEPHLGDLVVYGALRSIEGLPAHDRIFQQDRPLTEWYQRTQSKVAG